MNRQGDRVHSSGTKSCDGAARDHSGPTSVAGVWAGGHDAMRLGRNGGPAAEAVPQIPIFSVRTFLSAAEMRPTEYLLWKNDPACRIV